jgi:DNA replication protein DnaC
MQTLKSLLPKQPAQSRTNLPTFQPANAPTNLQPVCPPADGYPNCPHCRNMRWLLDANGLLVPCAACQVVASWVATSLSKYSSANGIAKTQTFENFADYDGSLHHCKQAAQAFATNPQGWLIITGKYGNGKSHLCAAVYNHLQTTNRAAIFVTMPDLAASIRECFSASEEEQNAEARIQVYRKSPILILDDFGAEKTSEWVDELAFRILDYRYRMSLPTMITSNRALAKTEPRLASRLSDARFTLIENTAGDFRRLPPSQRDALIDKLIAKRKPQTS